MSVSAEMCVASTESLTSGAARSVVSSAAKRDRHSRALRAALNSHDAEAAGGGSTSGGNRESCSAAVEYRLRFDVGTAMGRRTTSRFSGAT
jgi:hypothetical protein